MNFHLSYLFYENILLNRKFINLIKYGKLKDQLNMLKYELKEKDMDIVQLQKEINELQLENKMYKSKIALLDNELVSSFNEFELQGMDVENPFVSLSKLKIFYFIFVINDKITKQIKEMLVFKREKDCALEELIKAQDTIAQMQMEKSTKNIETYDMNNSLEILKKKLSN